MPNWKVSQNHGYHGQKDTYVTTLGNIHYGAVTTTRMFRVECNNHVQDVTVIYYNNTNKISICDVDLSTLCWLERCKAFAAIRKNFYQ